MEFKLETTEVAVEYIDLVIAMMELKETEVMTGELCFEQDKLN